MFMVFNFDGYIALGFMSSNRLRREEIKQRRSSKRETVRIEAARTQAKRIAKEKAGRLEGQVLVNVANLLPTNSYCTPDFVDRGFYIDKRFSCKTCGVAQVWTATQQKWWYESAKGDVWKVAVLCRPCRLRERKRKEVARQARLDGLAKKAQRAT